MSETPVAYMTAADEAREELERRRDPHPDECISETARAARALRRAWCACSELEIVIRAATPPDLVSRRRLCQALKATLLSAAIEMERAAAEEVAL